ncbi:MAG: carotenoid biosynthesis protein [Actinomycetes bacterium]
MNVKQILVDNRPLPLLLGLITVLLNIVWTLVHDATRAHITIAAVISFAAMSLVHATLTRGSDFANRVFTTTVITSFVAEFLGLHTHIIFGHYEYTDQLGMQLFGVPLLIPLAWFMMMYPCLLVGHSISTNPISSSAITAALMTAWDLYLDPQMTHEVYWFWRSVTDSINGIPVSNYLSWFFVAFLISHAINKTVEPTPLTLADFAPFAMLIWVWLGSFLANIVPFAPFLDQPAVAVTGLIGMGAVMIPVIMRMRQV